MDGTQLRPEPPNPPAAAADRLSEAKRALVAMRLRQKRSERATRERIVRIERHGMLPVSEQQRYLWFLHQVAPHLPTYNVPLALRLAGPLDLAALHTALTAVAERHESLRTRFGDDHGVPYQLVDPPQPVRLDRVDLSYLPPPERDEKAAELLDAQAALPFDLEAGPVLRCWLARIADDEHLMLLCFHHIVTDGWSARIVASDLAELYDAACEGREPRLAEQDIQPVDYAAWQQQWLTGEVLDAQLGYWRARLADVPLMDLPTDHPRPLTPSGAGLTFERDLDAQLGPRVAALAEQADASLLAVLLAAFSVVLHRHTGQPDLAVGSVYSGRTRSQIESLVGFFANTLVLRTSLAGDPTFTELVGRANEAVLGALGHQDIPFGTLVDRLNPDRVPGRNPLFQLSFTLMNESIAHRFRFHGLTTEPVTPTAGTARFDLAVQVNAKAGGVLRVWTEFATDLFRPDRIERMVDQFEQVLGEAVADPQQHVSAMTVLPPAERDRVLSAWNPAPHPYDDAGQLLCDVVAGWAEREPDAVAVRWEGEDYTYGWVHGEAVRLAHLLRDQHGVGPDVVVGLLLDRGVDLPVGQLAVQRAGGAWLPLDPANPEARIAFLLQDAGVRAVLTTTELAGLLPADVPRVCLDDPEVRARLAEQPDTPPTTGTRPEHLAYVIYTSGSTGTPKGVLISHRSVVNFVATVRELFSLAPGDRVLQFANPAFDVSVFDVYAALGSGATLVCAPKSVLLDPPALAELMRTERVTVTDLPPAVLGVLDPDQLPDLRTLFVGLEAFPAELVNRFRTPAREFHNGYGPTEATIACVDYSCPAEPLTEPPPIGRAMANARAYVLDADLEPAPIGVPGQLYIAGVGLARGYVGRPDLTADRFVPCPYGEPGERMYATGDVVRWRSDGNLVFLGRVDRQVKIRGLRIELGEIEAALVAHQDVRQAAVVVHEAPGGPQLAAYVVPSDGTVDRGSLTSHLSERLPLHMVPPTTAVLDALPLTPSGKLDEARLPKPEPDVRPHVAPATPTESALAEIWHELLDVDAATLSVHDSFFGLGGNSLLATQLISRVRDAYGVSLDPRELFTHPLLHQLAGLVDEAETAALGDDELAEVEDELSGLSEEEIDRMLAAEQQGER